MTRAALVKGLRKALRVLPSRIEIPFPGMRIAVEVSRRRKAPAPTAAVSPPDTIMVHHIETMIARCPPLRRFYHPDVSLSEHDAGGFFEFCNDAVALFTDAARETQLRRLLTRLRDQLVSAKFRDQITQRIAESDLRSGVIDRALILKDVPEFASQVANEIDVYDRHYGAPAGFLRSVLNAGTWDGDVRGRTLKRFFSRNDALVRGKRILHVAPEQTLRDYFRDKTAELGCTYDTLDGYSDDTTYRADLCRLPIADGSYDVVICHRVLEHILDDGRAISELRRVLGADGMLNVSVPQAMNRETTNEWLASDASHHMHVRHYGRDFPDRLRAAGFDVSVEKETLTLPLADHLAAGTLPLRHYLCWKRDA